MKRIIVLMFAAILLSGCGHLWFGNDLEDTAGPPAIPPPRAATQAEMEAGTEVGLRSVSPLLTAQAISALAGTGATEVVDADVGVAGNTDTTHAYSKDDVYDWTVTHGAAADPHAGYTLESLFDAHTMIYATADNTPAALAVAEQRVVGRVTGGDISALTLGNAAGNVAQWPADPAAHTLFGFDNTGNIYRSITIGTNLTYTQATNTLDASGGFTGGTLTSELVIDETGIEGQPTDAITTCSSFAATGGGIFYDDSEGKWKKCQDNVLTDLDTNSGGATAWDDIADPDAAATIAFAGYQQIISSTLNSAGANLTLTNTTADLTADVSFIDLKYTDDGDANGYFLRGYDNAGADLKWSIDADGVITAGGFATNGADGTHYVTALNTTALSSTPTDGNLAFLTDRYYMGDGTDYNDYLVSHELIDTWAEQPALTSAYILVGNGSNQPAAVNPGGDVEIDNTGVTTIQTNAVDSSMINTIVDSAFWDAGGMTPDGTQCADTARVTINSGPAQYTVICADNDASSLYGHIVMPDSWDGGTVTAELEYLQTAADTGALNADISMQCRGAGETVSSTWGTEVAIDDAAVTGSNAVDHTTSGAVTPNGTCAAGDTLYWMVQLDATGTTTAVATLHFLGLKMEYTSNVGD